MQTAQPRLELLNQIRDDFSDRFTFKRGKLFTWSSADETIYYSTAKEAAENAVWSLLHEIGHADLGHKQYKDDLELLMMEVEAWRRAKLLADGYHLVIDELHIQECLDSYRDWLHQRSRCIECKMHSFQIDTTTYECFNCSTRWKVPASRMCVVRKRRVT
jgi:hypothetical protein